MDFVALEVKKKSLLSQIEELLNIRWHIITAEVQGNKIDEINNNIEKLQYEIDSINIQLGEK